MNIWRKIRLTLETKPFLISFLWCISLWGLAIVSIATTDRVWLYILLSYAILTVSGLLIVDRKTNDWWYHRK